MGDSSSTPPPPAKLSRFRQGLVGLAPLALLAAWFAGGTKFHSFATEPPPPPPEAAPPDGTALFVRNCAYCHGETGTGVGLAGLTPRARYFGRDKYKFTSTHKGDQGGMPTDDDLLYVIRRGIPGSAMPAFGDKLTDAEQRAVVARLRTLTRTGLAERYRLEAVKNDEDPDWKEIAKRVEKEAAVGEPDVIPPMAAATPDAVLRGQILFSNVNKTACASCHGVDGKGEGPNVVSDKKNDPPWQGGDGEVNRPRNLTTGVLKGGKEKERLYARVFHGIPGTPMPPHNKLSAAEVSDLIDYVLAMEQFKQPETK